MCCCCLLQVPIFNGQVLLGGVRRVNVGGKVLTNYLKELVSYRQLNMMDETYLIDTIKEALCFVSADVRKDLAAVARQGPKRWPLRAEFVLPDGVHNLKGHVRAPPGTAPPQQGVQQQPGEAAPPGAQAPGQQGAPTQAAAPVATSPTGSQPQGGPQRPGRPSAPGGLPQEQVLQLVNERFMVPELLFHPGDVGLPQAGLPEALVQAVSACHCAVQPLLYSNILLTGGCTKFPGFMERFAAELRALVPDTCQVHISSGGADPGLTAWRGMSQFVSSGEYWRAAVTRQQWEAEQGRWQKGPC